MARTSRRKQQMSEEINTIYSVAGYIRLSVTKENHPSESVENQIKMINDFIDIQENMYLYKFYIDENGKGTDFNRKKFQNMIDDISSGKVNCVIVKDLSRLGRDSISVGYYIQHFFPSKGVRFISLNDDFDTLDGISDKSDPHRPLSRIPVSMLADEYYVNDISNKVSATIENNIKNGKYVAPRAPFGYKKADDDCHKLIIDNEAASKVRVIFDLAYEHKGLNQIARILNEKGYTTPMTYALANGLKGNYNSGNGLWNTRTIRSILTNKVYIGDLEQGKENYLVKNTHEVIISRDMFDKVQLIINKKLATRKENPSVSDENIFRGKIICGDCGGKMQRRKRSNKHEEYYYFSCITNNRVASDKCGGMYVKETDIILELKAAIQKFIMDNEKEYLSLKAQKTDISECLNHLYEDKLTDNNIQNLYEKYITGEITKECFISMKDKIVNQKQLIGTYENEINSIQTKLNFFDLVYSDNIKLIIKDCVKNIVIHKNKEILINFSIY
mgnify:CR=1 FL=1